MCWNSWWSFDMIEPALHWKGNNCTNFTKIGITAGISNEYRNESENGENTILFWGGSHNWSKYLFYFSGMFRKDEELTPSQRGLAVRFVPFNCTLHGPSHLCWRHTSLRWLRLTCPRETDFPIAKPASLCHVPTPRPIPPQPRFCPHHWSDSILSPIPSLRLPLILTNLIVSQLSASLIQLATRSFGPPFISPPGECTLSVSSLLPGHFSLSSWLNPAPRPNHWKLCAWLLLGLLWWLSQQTCQDCTRGPPELAAPSPPLHRNPSLPRVTLSPGPALLFSIICFPVWRYVFILTVRLPPLLPPSLHEGATSSCLSLYPHPLDSGSPLRRAVCCPATSWHLTVKTVLAITVEEEVLLTSSGWRPGMLNILRCPWWSTKRVIVQKYNASLRSPNLGQHIVDVE